jgi:hypothetical protein
MVVRADSALWSTERALSDPLVVGLEDATFSVSIKLVVILIGS